MTVFGYAARALALSLSLTATGAFCVAGAPPAPAATSIAASDAVSTPVGGEQLAGRGIIVNLEPGVPAPPAMPGASYLIADMDTGQILAAKAPHARYLPASTLKTLTALTLIPLLDSSATIKVTPQDANAQGSHLGILPNTEYSVRTLMQGMLTVSGNDAAYALARGNHSVAATLKAMNATAADLHALDTVAKDPSGLDKPGQTSSAYDLALIGRAAMKLPDFGRYVAVKQATLPGGRSVKGKRTPGFKITSHNRLLYNYRGAIGIKTGYTIAAKQTYIGAATRGGKTYIITQMSSPNGSWRPPAALLNWAFAHGSSVTPIGELVEPGIVPTQEPILASGARGQSSPGTSLTTAPRESALGPALPAWIGVIGVITALAVLRARALARTRARARARTRRRTSRSRG